MNVKTLLLICLCAIGVTANANPTDPPVSAEQIHLHGTLDLGLGSNDIEAYVDENAVYLSFHRNFGTVTVTVYNPNNLIIYSGVVNTAVQQVVVIPVSLSAEGLYTIVLDNAVEYAEGEFEQIP